LHFHWNGYGCALAAFSGHHIIYRRVTGAELETTAELVLAGDTLLGGALCILIEIFGVAP